MGIVHAKEPNVPIHPTLTNEVAMTNSSKPEVPFKEDTDIFKKDHNDPKVEVIQIDLSKVKVRVDKIHIDGLMRTKDDIVAPQVKELFETSCFQDLIINTHKIRGKLESLGCFKDIGINIDTSHGPDATTDGVEVTFKVKELSKLSGGVSTLVGNNEASIMVGAKAPNLLGRGERVQMEYSYGHHYTSNINISLIKPFLTNKLSKTLTASIYKQFGEFPWSGYNENDKGFLLDYAFNSNETGTVKHNLQYEAAVRDLIAVKNASFKVREQSGPTLKSAIRHIITVDKRDGTIFPTSGTLAQCTTEIAGLGGNVGFIKNELLLQSNWTPHKYVTLQLAGQTGFLKSVSNDMQIGIMDHFFLGGPLNLRGFNMRGCGPRDNGDSLGGNTFWAGALHVYTPLPFRPAKEGFGDLFRFHGFINAGNVNDVRLESGRSYEDTFKLLTENYRCTAGCGIAMKIGDIARVELNFCMPIKFLRTDIQQRIQLGLGVQYL